MFSPFLSIQHHLHCSCKRQTVINAKETMQREIRKLSQWISRTLHETADFPDTQQIKVNSESTTTKYIISSHSKPLKMLSSAGQFFISRLQWHLPCTWTSYIDIDVQNHTPQAYCTFYPETYGVKFCGKLQCSFYLIHGDVSLQLYVTRED